MTKAQMDTIEHRQMNDVTREMLDDGVTMTHDESDEIGAAGRGWLRTRLGLIMASTDEGVSFYPRGERVLVLVGRWPHAYT